MDQVFYKYNIGVNKREQGKYKKQKMQFRLKVVDYKIMVVIFFDNYNQRDIVNGRVFLGRKGYLF